MDIMDSTDTPTGGLDGTTASSSSGALPLSVDERDSFSSSDDSRSAGSVPTSSLPGESFSAGSTAFDRLDAVSGGARIDEDLPNALPTSQDDLFYPQQELSTHPSVLSQDASSTLARTTHPHSLSPMGDDAEDAATSAKDSVSSAAQSAKEKAGGMMDTISNKLHQAGDMASKEYQHLKAEASAHMPSSSSSSSSTSDSSDSSSTHPVKHAHAESTDTHPDAASMRDTHLHTNLTSLATHANEVRAPSDNPHQSAAQTRGLEAAAASVEPKDASAGGGLMGALGRAHATLESGVESMKDRVDDWAEKNLRSSPKDGDHLSEAEARDLPTLVDTSNEKNTDYVRAKMHPSAERAGASSIQEK